MLLFVSKHANKSLVFESYSFTVKSCRLGLTKKNDVKIFPFFKNSFLALALYLVKTKHDKKHKKKAKFLSFRHCF